LTWPILAPSRRVGRSARPRRDSGKHPRRRWRPRAPSRKRTRMAPGTERKPGTMMTTRANGRTTETIPDPGDGIRLQKYLADAGVASRREGERLIEAGPVEGNGKVITTQEVRVDPRRDVVPVDQPEVP